MADEDLPSFLDRKVVEYTDLHERACKMRLFIDINPIFGTLPAVEQQLMNDQLRAMQEYRKVLADRIRRTRERLKGEPAGAPA